MQATESCETASKARVAVVDDDPRIRRLLEDELIDEGYAVSCYDNGFDLIEELTAYNPELILLDLLMPQMDGIECLRTIRKKDYSGPVIVFTALSDNQKRQEAEHEGASEYVLKPDLFENLDKILTRHLAK